MVNWLAPFSPIGPSPLAPNNSAENTDSGMPTESPTVFPIESSTRTLEAGDVRTIMRGDVEVEQVYVPAGSFLMGSEEGADDERPVHEVMLDAFWIDRTEVTNAQYQACVNTDVCNPPSDYSSSTRPLYYGQVRYGDYPAVYVNWNDSTAFCEWAGGRLPREAEWEYAARGLNSLTYPWGEELPACNLLNYTLNCVGDTSETGAYHDGESWVGALDMAGNVWEWVEDWYAESYYESSPRINPTGPDIGVYRVMRGGSWGSDDPFRIRSSYRNILNYPHFSGYSVGFRCAQD